jgi:hypothetical protein
MAIGMNLAKAFVLQPGDAGAWPSILAATDPAAKPGAYYGPQGMGEFRGPPGLGKIKATALDTAVGARLWDTAETLTGADFKPAP